MPGHLRANCPLLQLEAMERDAKIEARQKEIDVLRESSDPLPVFHHDGRVFWQSERGDELS